MTIEEAKRIAQQYDQSDKVATEEETFLLTEAMDLLIREKHDPRDMMYLGGVYYEMRRFDLALKYYEMAEALDYEEAYECLGYIWYYGRTGEVDYRKAFECFSRLMEKGNMVATYKVADMYKNGYYVEKDEEKYKSIIKELFGRVRKCKLLFDPVPEVYVRMAKIKSEEGRNDEAIALYNYARDFLAQRIRYNAFFGNLNIMKWLVNDLYKITDFDEKYMDIYDLFYVCRSPHKISFMFEDKEMTLETVMDGDECNVCFNGKWFRNIDAFFANGEVCGERITAVGSDLYDFKVVA